MTRHAKFFLNIAATILFLIPSILPAQREAKRVTPASQLRSKLHEVFEGKYIPTLAENQRTSPAYRFSTPRFFMTQVNVSSGANIFGDAANEPTIAIDPTNSNKMAIAWRQFNTVTNSFRQAGYGYTTDGGQTWTFPGVLDPGVFRSDPVLSSDADGNFYYNSLTTKRGGYSCDVYKSTDGGALWDFGTFAYGGDKQWMVIDKSGSIGKDNIYAFWTAAYSWCPPESFTRSTPLDFSFFEGCTDIPSSPFWGTLAMTSDGTLFIGARGDTSFVLAKSTTARDPNVPVSWDTVTSVDLDGDIVFGSDPNPGGLGGQTWVAVDNSSGPTHGDVYMLCSVHRYSTSDPLDVMFARSTDGGFTWGSPVRINDDADSTNFQWFGTMSVAPNGRIDVIWLDTRDNPGTVLSSLYYSFSVDGGMTWSANERLSGSFDPHLGWPIQNKMGDYFHMVSENSGAHLAWAATFNGEQDVYYGHINESSSANTRTISVNSRWNLLSVPLLVDNYAKSSLFPDAISNAFWYQGSSYEQKDTLAIGTGYWLKFASPDTLSIIGNPIVSETIAVREGWNMIGSPSARILASGITSNPPGIVTSEFFGFRGSYVSTMTLEPGNGYWVMVNQAGTLTLSSSSTVNSSASIRIIPTAVIPPPAPENDYKASMISSTFALEQNYPNPFNPTTMIEFSLPEQSFVTLKIYNSLGQEVASALDRQVMDDGPHQVAFNALNLPSGVYSYRIVAEGLANNEKGTPGQQFINVRKMLLLK